MDKNVLITIMMITFIIGTTATEMLKHYMRAKRTHSSQADDELKQLRQQNQHLEKRVQVLEKIVTENSYELNQQLKSL
ncbi:hypothetical protein [Shewanella sp. Isolate11]|uniref:hypothetical protein n=1 Tax=Shewanella sp. Isolate11 TaxID=2908530 RepID=UPI001EFC9E67|nr:hypothetical protein [Shewanella sp. Isolate11]MCG9698419.1 hypothetical protein [Shewanella sp. Isolate11]